MAQLGGHAIYLTNDVVLGARESVRDVAHNLERFVDGDRRRGRVRTRSSSSSRPRPTIPVINGLTLREHPCQALADVFTIEERFGRLEGVVLAFVGDGNNVYHSLALVGAAMGMEVRLAHPAGLRARTSGSSPRATELADGRRRQARLRRRTRARSSAARTSSTRTPGRRWARRPRPRSGATPSAATRSTTPCSTPPGPDVLAMHCLPAHRGEEITSEVMDGPRSLIFDQSENRLHVQKALLVEFLGRGGRGMTDAFERYKDALRRGHVGRACAAASTRPSPPTSEAGAIAPDRAMPQSSLGGVLARMGRTAQALAAYDAALRRAPDDEAALRGRAELLAMAGRRAEAADTLDRLGGRAATRPAVSATRADAGALALELAESRSRRRGRRRSWSGRLREAGDTAAADALAAAARHRRRGPTAPAAAPEPKRDPRRAVLSAAAVLTATADDGARRRRPRRGPPRATSRPQRPSGRSGTSTPRSTPATRPSRWRRPPVTSTWRSPSSTWTAAGGRRPRTSWSCWAG